MIDINNLNAGYGKLVILHDLELRITPGRLTTVLGANGSGKSTLLKTIFGLTTVFSGTVRFDGRDLVGTPTEAINCLGIAYVPQRLNVFTAMTVNDNLRLAGRMLSKTDKARSLEAARELFPILAKRERQPAGQLSGGERQMLAIAVGWLSRPRLMLLDEPTAGLSPLIAKSMFAALQQLLSTGMTLVVVEQNARTAVQHADEVAVLREGRVIYTGTAVDFAADEERQKDYLGVSSSVIPIK